MSVLPWGCFHHAERILSAIAKFLVHLFGKRRGGLNGDRDEVGEESEEGRRRNGKLECTKNSSKTQQIWHLGTSLGVTAPYRTFFESSFQGQQLHRR